MWDRLEQVKFNQIQDGKPKVEWLVESDCDILETKELLIRKMWIFRALVLVAIFRRVGSAKSLLSVLFASCLEVFPKMELLISS